MHFIINLLKYYPRSGYINSEFRIPNYEFNYGSELYFGVVLFALDFSRKMWYNNIKRIKNERFDKNPVCFPGLSSPSNGNDMPQNTNAPHGYPPCGAILHIQVIDSVSHLEQKCDEAFHVRDKLARIDH